MDDEDELAIPEGTICDECDQLATQVHTLALRDEQGQTLNSTFAYRCNDCSYAFVSRLQEFLL